MNFLDYLDWRGDITFAEKDLNEVDNLIFSTLAYLNMEDLVSSDDSLSPTIAELLDAYSAAGYDQSAAVQNPRPLLEKAAVSTRFKDVRVSYYVNEVDVDKQVQFSAVCFRYREGKTFIAFRGTDNTIVGWREDCNFSFSKTRGQQAAAAYIDRVATLTDDSLIVGGHSKGGNFAVFGAAFCRPDVRDTRIRRVYSNDGPGLTREAVDSAEYAAILDRTVKIIPEASLVGILLASRVKRVVIKSDAKGAMQHNPYTWQVLGCSFVPADERAQSSVFLDDTLSRWVDTLSEENLRVLFDVIFDSLEASGASTLGEINENKAVTYTAILKALSKVDTDRKSDIKASLKKLLESGVETIRETARFEET